MVSLPISRYVFRIPCGRVATWAARGRSIRMLRCSPSRAPNMKKFLVRLSIAVQAARRRHTLAAQRNPQVTFSLAALRSTARAFSHGTRHTGATTQHTSSVIPSSNPDGRSKTSCSTCTWATPPLSHPYPAPCCCSPPSSPPRARQMTFHPRLRVSGATHASGSFDGRSCTHAWASLSSWRAWRTWVSASTLRADSGNSPWNQSVQGMPCTR